MVNLEEKILENDGNGNSNRFGRVFVVWGGMKDT